MRTVDIAVQRGKLVVERVTDETLCREMITFVGLHPAHNLMHGAKKLGLASLTNLDQLPPTGAVLITPPLKIEKGSGSPLRVLALVAA